MSLTKNRLLALLAMMVSSLLVAGCFGGDGEEATDDTLNGDDDLGTGSGGNDTSTDPLGTSNDSLEDGPGSENDTSDAAPNETIGGPAAPPASPPTSALSPPGPTGTE